MITVTVSKKNNSYISFVSEGHADYAEEGQDIICAAVSALVINTVNSLEQLTAPISEGGTLLMNSLLLGLTEIEHSYSKRYLKVKVREV